jgi:putative membrane protein
MMTGMLGMVMWLMMGLMLLGLAAGSIPWVRRRLKERSASPQARHGGETAEEVLRRRYAAGEIDRYEYQRRQRDLTESEH